MVAFLDLWNLHPRDVERLTVSELRTLRHVADQRIAEAEAESKRR